MKTLFHIIFRYAVSAVGVMILLLFFNFGAFVLYAIESTQTVVAPLEYKVRDISQALEQTPSGWQLPDAAREQLLEIYSWAMLLDPEGNVVWEEQLPERLEHRYTPAQVASFTRWYLDDYPVYAYEVQEDHLLVLASPQGSRWKYPIEMGRQTMDYLFEQIPIWVAANLFLAMVLLLLSSIQFFRSIRRVAGGLTDLAAQKPVKIPEKGLFGSLYHDLNQTSKHLIRQQETLNQRDRMRTEWIAGVSHDVRTPLTIALGNASQIETDGQLPKETRRKAQTIRVQCERLRRLIEDLNLASKLTYHAQPVRRTSFDPAALIRRIAAEFLNQNAGSALSLEIDHACEGIKIQGDPALLERAVRNLLLNSIQHNQQACEILIHLRHQNTFLQLEVSDTGQGYPEEVLRQLQQPMEQSIPTHGLGLSIVRQIMALHGGTAYFCNMGTGAKAVLTLPVTQA